MRRLTVMALATAALGLPSRGAAQLYFSIPDTAVIILVDSIAQFDIYLFDGRGVSAYDITLFLDDARVRVRTADSVQGYNLPRPTVTTTAGQARLTANRGSATTALSTTFLARVTLEMDAAATRGSLISVRVNSITAADFVATYGSTVRTHLLNVCQSAFLYGDIDNSRSLTSRDALIAISAAVGLPTTGFDISRGDGDEDNQTTTRDALYILSQGIGLNTFTKAGTPKPNACVPREPAPTALAVWNSSSQVWRVAAGDTVPQLVGSFQGIGYPPSWAPDASEILLNVWANTNGYDFIRVRPNGTIVDTLRVSSGQDYGGDWSPDGTRVAYLSQSVSPPSVFVAHLDGTNPVRLTDTIYVSGSVSWNRAGTEVTFAGYNQSQCCNRKAWVMNANGTGIRQLWPQSNLTHPDQLVFSPAGDSLAYRASNRIFRLAATNDSAGFAVSSLNSSQEDPDWLPTGIALKSTVRSSWWEVFVRRNDGRHVMVLRHQTGVNWDDFRFHRVPAVYVNTVTVTPGAPVTLSLSGTTTQLLSIAALDNLGGAITPGSGFRWRSTNAAVASVGPTTGTSTTVTALTQGTTLIIGTAGGWRADTVSVTVNP